FRGLLSVHSRYGLHTHQVTFMTLYTGGVRRFVTSTTAPIATGWNESCRAGFAPAGKPCLCTAHMIKDVIVPCSQVVVKHPSRHLDEKSACRRSAAVRLVPTS